jgi:branched-chain amino acid transport system substrate-binding protein
MKIFLTILMILFSACSEYKKEKNISNKSIHVAVLAPLSGKNKKYGIQSLKGLEIANEMQKFSENGDNIVLKIIDTKSDINITRNAINTLDKDTVALFSFMGSNEMLQLKDDVDAKEIPTIVTIATHSDVSSKDNYISQVCMDNHEQTLVASHYLRDEKLIKNIGILYNNDSTYSKSLANDFRKYFEKIRGDVDFFIDISHNEWLNELESKNNPHTQMIFSVIGVEDSMMSLELLDSLNWDIEILSSDGLLSNALIKDPDKIDMLDGIYVVDHYASDVHKSFKQREFKRDLQESGFEHSSYAYLAYDGYALLMNALKYCQSDDKKCIHAMINNSGIVEGIAGNFSIKDAKAHRAIYIDKIDNSELKKEIVVY